MSQRETVHGPLLRVSHGQVTDDGVWALVLAGPDASGRYNLLSLSPGGATTERSYDDRAGAEEQYEVLVRGTAVERGSGWWAHSDVADVPASRVVPASLDVPLTR